MMIKTIIITIIDIESLQVDNDLGQYYHSKQHLIDKKHEIGIIMAIIIPCYQEKND